jgi:hypothetical protein
MVTIRGGGELLLKSCYLGCETCQKIEANPLTDGVGNRVFADSRKASRHLDQKDHA